MCGLYAARFSRCNIVLETQFLYNQSKTNYTIKPNTESIQNKAHRRHVLTKNRIHVLKRRLIVVTERSNKRRSFRERNSMYKPTILCTVSSLCER